MSKLGVLIWRHVFEFGEEKKLKTQLQDLSDLRMVRDIPYEDDQERGHLFDIYELPELPEDAPVLINIHGGGLFSSYKEINVNFNCEWARLGYRVVSLSYRLIPETTLWHQIDDIMAALRYLKEHEKEYHLKLDRCVLTGDSAGALLSLFAMSIDANKDLQKAFGIESADISVRAVGLVSIMLDTQRHDLMSALNSVITEKSDKGKAYEKYLLDPTLLLQEANLPPVYLVTSEEDLIRKDTLKLDRLLTENGKKHKLLKFPKGAEHKLMHVFSVLYPKYPESRKVFSKMDAYFREAL